MATLVTAPIALVPQAAIGLIYFRRSMLYWGGFVACTIAVLVFAYIYRGPVVKRAEPISNQATAYFKTGH